MTAKPIREVPGSGNAGDVSRLKGMLGPDPRKLKIALA
jgi:hypothetical protein